MLAKIGRLLSGSKPKFQEFQDDSPEYRPARPHADMDMDTDPFRSRFWQDSIQEWIYKLDENLRPTELTERYPRITAKIMTHWSEPESLKSYMDSLVHDQRGERQGFPGSIPLELARLHDFVMHRPSRPKTVKSPSLHFAASNWN